MRDGRFLRIADVNEATGVVEAAKSGPQPAKARLVLEIPGARQHRRRNPAQRCAAVLGAADVEAALDGHLEDKSGAGSEFEIAHATRGAVVGDDETHAGNLGHVTDAAAKLFSGQFLPEQFHEIPPLLSVS